MNTALWHQQAPGARYAESWALSIVLHASAIALAVTELSGLQLVPQRDAFRWEVSVVGTTSDSTASETPIAPTQPLTSQAEPVVPAVRQPVTPPPQKARPSPRKAAPKMMASTPPPVPREPQEQSLPKQSQPAQEAASTLMKDTQSVPGPPTEQTTNVSERTPDMTTRETTAVESLAPSRSGAIMPSSPSPPVLDTTGARDQSSPAESSVLDDTPVPSPSPDPSMVARVPDAPTTSELPGLSTPPRPVGQPPAQVAGAPFATTGKPDFSWLTDSLRNKVKESQKYSTVARLNGLEGRVVLRITVKENGELLVAISKSSGHDLLDQEALAQIKRLSPFPLPQPLGREKQVLNLPIIYSLNR